MRGEAFTEFTLERRYFSDIRTLTMVRKFGSQAIACHLDVLSELFIRRDHRLSKAEFMAFAELHDVQDPNGLFDYMLQDHVAYLYFRDGVIGSEGVDRKVESRSEKREEWRKGKRGGKKSDLPRDFQPPSEDVPIPFSQPSSESVSGRCAERPSPTPTPTPTPQINKKEVSGEMPPEPPPESELERWADAQLKPVEEVSATQAYMTTGRRPMRKYPLILLTVPDLIEIRELYEKSKIPPEEFSRPFLKVKARLDAEMQKGAEPWRKDAKSWLIGWAYQESMRELKAQNDLQRSESWLNGSAS